MMKKKLGPCVITFPDEWGSLLLGGKAREKEKEDIGPVVGAGGLARPPYEKAPPPTTELSSSQRIHELWLQGKYQPLVGDDILLCLHFAER